MPNLQWRTIKALENSSMATFPLRIQFKNEDIAMDSFYSFPPGDLDFIEGWSRKRVGDSQLILLNVADESNLRRFFELCRANPEIIIVMPISEMEFEDARSEAV
jgi:hypothetical protein